MKTLKATGKLFPNGLGMEVKRSSAGSWDVWFPDPAAKRCYYVANYIKRGDTQASRSGRGDTVDEAIANAVPVGD